MRNTESNKSNAAGSSKEDSARRWRENTATAVTAVGVVTTVVAAGWALTKLLSSSASEEDEKTNDKGKCMVDVGTTSKGKLMKATVGKLKMNTDGSVRGDPARAGFGGVIRDERGRWIMGFYGRISGDCRPEQAELWGIYHGLKIIQGEKLRVVEIKSDSEPAIIHLQKDQTSKKSPMKDIIEECKGMLQSTGCKLVHTGNKENRVADRLADLGRNQEKGLVRFITPPDQETKRLLEADARSASSY